MKLDDGLFTTGILDGDFVIKAQLRVPVRMPLYPASEEIISQLTTAYAQRLALMQQEIEGVLHRRMEKSDVRLIMVEDGGKRSMVLMKADKSEADIHHKQYTRTDPRTGKLQTIQAKNPNPDEMPDPEPAPQDEPPPPTPPKPAAQEETKPKDTHEEAEVSSKWWKNEHGHVKLAAKPIGEYDTPATAEDVRRHYMHYRPVPMAHDRVGQKEMMKVLYQMKDQIGMDETDFIFLNWWTKKGQGLFKKSFQLSDEDMKGDLSQVQLRIKGEEGKISYEEGVSRFYAAQDWGAPPEAVEEALKGTFQKYRDAMEHPAVFKAAQKHLENIERSVNGYYIKAEDSADHFDKLGEAILSEGDPQKLHAMAISGLAAMDLLRSPKKGEVAAGFGGQKGAIVPNNNLLVDDESWFLASGKKEFDRLSSAQMSTIVMASYIQDMFDAQKAEYHADVLMLGDGEPQTEVGKHALERLKAKLGTDDVTFGKIKDRLRETASDLAERLNDANHSDDRLTRALMDLGLEGLSDEKKVKEATEQIYQWEQLKESNLKAQQSTELAFPIPDTMKAGRWGGHGEEDKTKLQPHQISKVTGDAHKPFLHQVQSLNWMHNSKRGLIALDAGLGKTPTVITFMEQLKALHKESGGTKGSKRAIIFLPPSLMMQWPGEIEGFAPGSSDKILNLAGMSLEQRKMALKSDMAKNAEYILLSTGTLTDGKLKGEGSTQDETIDDGTGGSDNELTQAINDLDGAVFIDEVHQGGFKTWGGYKKDDETGETKFQGSVRHHLVTQIMKNREYGFGMTATPVPNHPQDLFHLGNLFNPGALGAEEEWQGKLNDVNYNSDTNQWEVGDPQAIVELNKRTKPWVFAKLITDPEVVADMKKGLPAIHSNAIDLEPSDVPCPVTGVSQLDYLRPDGVIKQLCAWKMEALADKKRKEMAAKMGVDPSHFADQEMYQPVDKARITAALTIGLQRQAAISPELIDPRYKGPSPKMDKFVEDVLSHFQGGGGTEDKPIVGFSSFPKKAFPILMRKLVERGVDPSRIGIISGEKGSAERAMEQDLTNEGKRKILLVGTMSGGAGLNLQKKSNKMLFLDEPWHPAAKRQAQGRVWRTGQENEVQMHTYRMVGSYDIDIESKIAGKQTMTSALLGAPDPEAFAGAAEKATRSLSGRVIGGGVGTGVAKQDRKGNVIGEVKQDLSKHQMEKILKNAGPLRLLANNTGLSGFLGEDFNAPEDEDLTDNAKEIDLDEMAKDVGGKSAKDAHKEMDAHAAKYDVDPKVKEEAMRTMPHAASGMDEDLERREWISNYVNKNGRQRFDLNTQLAEMAEAKGDTKTADACRKKAEAVKTKVSQYYDGLVSTAKASQEQAEVARKAGKTDEATKLQEKSKIKLAQAKEIQSSFPAAFEDLNRMMGDAGAKDKIGPGYDKGKPDKAGDKKKGSFDHDKHIKTFRDAQQAHMTEAKKHSDAAANFQEQGDAAIGKFNDLKAKNKHRGKDAQDLLTQGQNLSKQAADSREKAKGMYDAAELHGRTASHLEALKAGKNPHDEKHAAIDAKVAEMSKKNKAHADIWGASEKAKIVDGHNQVSDNFKQNTGEEIPLSANDSPVGSVTKDQIKDRDRKGREENKKADDKKMKDSAKAQNSKKMKQDFPDDEEDAGAKPPTKPKKAGQTEKPSKDTSQGSKAAGKPDKAKPAKPPKGDAPAKPPKEKPAPPADEGGTHPSGIKFKQKTLPIKANMKEFGSTGLPNAYVHHMWASLHDKAGQKHKSVQEWADKTIGANWNEEANGKYSPKTGLKVAKQVLAELKKQGIVEDY